MLSKTRLKKITALKNKKTRDKQNLFLIEGFRLCEEAIQSDFEVHNLFVNQEAVPSANYEKLIQQASQNGIKITEIDNADVKQLADTVNSQGIFAIIEQRSLPFELWLSESIQFLVIIDAGQDPGNIGTIIRTCDWFGIDAVVLSKGSVDLYNPKLIRSTMGSIFHLPVFENVDLTTTLPLLKEKGFTVYGADVQGNTYFHQVSYKPPLAVIMGNENKGIDSKIFQHIDYSIKIPSYGKAESLNLALAGAVIISRIVIQ